MLCLIMFGHQSALQTHVVTSERSPFSKSQTLEHTDMCTRLGAEDAHAKCEVCNRLSVDALQGRAAAATLLTGSISAAGRARAGSVHSGWPGLPTLEEEVVAIDGRQVWLLHRGRAAMHFRAQPDDDGAQQPCSFAGDSHFGVHTRTYGGFVQH